MPSDADLVDAFTSVQAEAWTCMECGITFAAACVDDGNDPDGMPRRQCPVCYVADQRDSFQADLAEADRKIAALRAYFDFMEMDIAPGSMSDFVERYEAVKRAVTEGAAVPPIPPVQALTKENERLATRLEIALEGGAQALEDARRLLGPARMVLDRCAQGLSGSAEEAEAMAQRIVDIIGHPVTDEPPHAVIRAEKAESEIAALTERLEAVEAERDRAREWAAAALRRCVIVERNYDHLDRMHAEVLEVRWPETNARWREKVEAAEADLDALVRIANVAEAKVKELAESNAAATSREEALREALQQIGTDCRYTAEQYRCAVTVRGDYITYDGVRCPHPAKHERRVQGQDASLCGKHARHVDLGHVVYLVSITVQEAPNAE